MSHTFQGTQWKWITLASLEQAYLIILSHLHRWGGFLWKTSNVISSGHLTILASFFPSLITSSSLTGQVSFPGSVRLRTHGGYNLPFASKGKPLLTYNSLNLLHPLLVLVITLSNAPLLASTVSYQYKKTFPTISRYCLLNFMLGQSSAMSVCVVCVWCAHVWH